MTPLVQIVAVTMAPDASWAVVVAGDGTVRTWGIEAVPRLICQTEAIDVGRSPAVTLAGERLRVLWGTEATIRLRENVEGTWTRDEVFPAPAQVGALALSSSGDLAVVACDDGTVRVVNAGTGEFGLTLATGGLTARAVAVASDQGPVIAALPDGSLRRYDLATGTSEIVGIEPGIRYVAVTPDGGTVIGVDGNGVLFRWKSPPGSRPDFRALGTAITALAADGTGDKVLVGTNGGQLWRHDLNGGPAIELGATVIPEAGTRQPGLGAIVDEDVRFTVYRPQALSPGVWASLLVFAHKTDLVEVPGQAPVDPVKQVEEIAAPYFRDAPSRQVSAEARDAIPRGARLRVEADLPGIRCDPEEAEFDWRQPVHHVVFSLLAGLDLVGSVVRGMVRVWWGPLLLGEVSVAINVTVGRPGAASSPVTDPVPRYRKIFPSYSHDDQAIVDACVEYARALGDQYLQDVLTLRSGERWRPRLAELIEEADVFQLFWSSRSMGSRYCQEEWEHALALKRPLFVRPLYWEDPMPEDLVRGLPPVALKEFHFVKVRYLAGGGLAISFEAHPLDAQGEAHEALGVAVAEYGRRVLTDPRLLGSLVTDLLPDLPRERSLLLAGAEAGIAADITKHVEEHHIDPDTAMQLAAWTLLERRALDPAASIWMASEYAQALGYPVRPSSAPAASDSSLQPSRGQETSDAIPATVTSEQASKGPASQSRPIPPSPSGPREPPGPGSRPLQGGASRPQRSGKRQKRSLAATISAAGVVGLGLVTAAVFGLAGTHPAAPRAAATPTPTAAKSLAPGVVPLPQLLPPGIADPSADCKTLTPPLNWTSPGLVQALQCIDLNLPGGQIYAFQMNSSANYLASWQSFNKWWGFDISQAGPKCPPSGTSPQGIYSWNARDFPARAGQVLECGTLGSGSNAAPTYVYTMPTEDAFFVAQGADGSSFTALDNWWSNDSMPITSPSP